MDANREEALRAKQIAEKKMENKEFSAALKIAQKAQQLYPELENISQLILVCEVHISSEKKSFGSDKDWYSILKIDPSSDDLSIKKQYRKLALVLHPDKNKFSGSTDAFKLIGEAQRVLLDPEKRTLHDNKRRAFSTTNWAPRQQPVVRQPQHSWNPVFPQGHSGNFAGDNFTGGRSGSGPGTGSFQFQRAKPGGSAVRLTFWTVCPFCSVRYQFYRDDVLNKPVHCQTCRKAFTAYELNIHAPQPSVPQRNTIPVPTPTPAPTPVPVPPKSKSKSKPTETQNVNKKRKKKVDESSESSDNGTSSSEEDEDEDEDSGDENSTESDENAPEKNQDSGRVGEQPRRSARPKRNVSYKENVNDHDHDHDDEAAPSKKRAPPSGTAKAKPEDMFWKAEVREPVKESQNQESHSNSDGKKVDVEDLESESEPEPEPEAEDEPESDPEVFECPDPEFNDFEKDRKEDSFTPGQIWALYDTEDAMPRFYAYIRKVQSPGFSLQITWLKPVPETDDETNWVEEELPVSCGNFKRGKPDKAEDLPMFSHLVTWEEVKRGIFNIIPRKGETWALFKDWNINWSNDGNGKYEYEFVEVLSNYDEGIGFRVSYLEKLAGFRCLFGQKEDGEMVIPESDKYRFSHMVPSCRMSGEEREGVPKGSYELDPAGLPASAFE
ncbi:uncharacterized protein LOC111918512 [Lactuca sativa]|nr:uncharacterized protein LOC111918512 [Lactuca sativa]XP_023769942.1 uncharacterized protein LOC111918512 [Lactuca sativa]XP_052625472.1 uncharacterized protein LOC111918512 [Lactuca sativa]